MIDHKIYGVSGTLVVGFKKGDYGTEGVIMNGACHGIISEGRGNNMKKLLKGLLVLAIFIAIVINGYIYFTSYSNRLMAAANRTVVFHL